MNLENNLGTDDIKKLVFKIALPAMFAQFVNVLYSVVDRIYVGNIPGMGELALAGVGICAPIAMLISAFAYLIGVGGAPLMSIKMGEQDNKGAKQILANCFGMLLIISIVIMILMLVFKESLLYLFGASENTYFYANQYFTIYLIGTIFALLAVGMNQFILCQGYAKIGMKSVIIGAVVNLILDPIFIFGFKMNVAGAALATVIGQLCSCLYVLQFLFSRDVHIRIEFSGYAWSIMKRILAVGATPFLIIAFDNILLISINAVLQKYGGSSNGDMLVACATILQSFMLIITMPLGGITGGTQTILGFNYGARNTKRVLEAEKYIFLISICFVGIMFLIAQTVPQIFVRIFTSNPEYIKLSTWAIRVYTLGLFGVAVQYTVVDGLTGMGIVNLSVSLSMFRKLIFLLCVFIIPMYFDVKNVFFAEAISDVIGATVTTFIYFTMFKKILHKRGQEVPMEEKE